MIYKVTLLKDTPTLKAGTMWKYYTENGKFDFSNQIDPDTLKVIYGGELMPREILDKPEWAKVEPFYEELDDLKCPFVVKPAGISWYGLSSIRILTGLDGSHQM